MANTTKRKTYASAEMLKMKAGAGMMFTNIAPIGQKPRWIIEPSTLVKIEPYRPLRARAAIAKAKG